MQNNTESQTHYMSRGLVEYVTLEIEGYTVQHLISFYHKHGFKDEYETDTFSDWIHNLNNNPYNQ